MIQFNMPPKPSKCPKCDNGSFEVVENEPRLSNFKLLFVQCDKCGAVAGVLDYHNIGETLKIIMDKLGIK